MSFSELIYSGVRKKTEFFQETALSFKSEINVGFGADAAFIRPMGVSITSLAVSNPEIFFNVYIFLGSAASDSLAKLAEIPQKYPNVKMTLYDVEEEKFSSLPLVASWASLATYFRLMMPLVLSHLDRILYLDADIFCLKSIDEIINLDMNGKVAAGVKDTPKVSKRKTAELSLPAETYFNAGILMIDIKKWNELDITERALDLLQKNPQKFSLLDQDALNILLNQNVHYLPKIWNHMHGKSRADIPGDIIFLHCSAHPKPWSCACAGKTQAHYLRYERLSPWGQVPLMLPHNSRYARRYAILLLMRGKLWSGLKWFIQYIKWRFL